MATTTLVDRDLEVGRKIIGALAQAGIPVSVAFWAHVPQIEEWQLFIATPLVDSKGPRLAYEQVLRALRNDGIDSELPWRRIFLRSPKDPVLKSLVKQTASSPRERFIAVNAAVGDRFVEDAYLYGSIFIVRAGSSRPHQHEYYSVIYTPHSGPRPPAPPLRLGGIEDVRRFLEKELRLDAHTVELQMEKLRAHQGVLVPVALTSAQLRTLGLS